MSKKIRFSLWLACLHLYALLFTGPVIWRAIVSGAISVGVFSVFTLSGFPMLWVGLAVTLAIIRLATR